jgi:hypothetical protein
MRPARFPILTILTVMGLLVSFPACRRGPKDKSVDAAADPSRPDVTGSELDEANAMAFLYGNWDESRECSVQKPADVPPTLVTVEGAYEIPDTAPERILLITAASPEGLDSHGQAPTIGGALFEKVPGGWKAAVRTPKIAEMGSYGKPPDGRLVQIGPKRWGVEYTPGFSNMGVTSGGFALIAEGNGALRQVLALTGTSEENGGACDEDQDTCYAFDSEVSYGPGANADWFDVEITTSGSRAGRDGKAEDFSETKRFVFDGKEYRIPVSGGGKKGVAR